MASEAAVSYARRHRPRFVEELKRFVRFPSVSAQPKHAADVAGCAAWLAAHLRHVGLERVQIVPTRRHPLVLASWRRLPHRPTVLVYGHYDVQPADPYQEWHTPPFAPEVRGADLYGRGACDDKGQMFAHVKALEACLRTAGRLPVNVQCLFEGEEEIGSPNLAPFLARHGRALRADVAIISDMPMPAPDRPAITYAMRGGMAFELEVGGPERDLHSGIYGGAVHNPLQALCEIVASLHDREGRIAIPGFYDSVREAGAAERAYMARIGPTDEQILRDARSARPWGEPGYTLYERTTLRPALTLNGVTGGYQGEGGKAVIPARGRAKLSFRLVPDQRPCEVERLLRQHLGRVTPRGVTVSLRRISAAAPALLDRSHPAMRAAAAACRTGFGADPIFLRSGGTIPVVEILQRQLGLPTVLMGFALPDDRMHAPNEKFHLPNFYHGIAASIAFLHNIARMARTPEEDGVQVAARTARAQELRS